MCNVTIRVKITYVGDFFGCPIGFNGNEYRIKLFGTIYRAKTLKALKNGLVNLILA